MSGFVKDWGDIFNKASAAFTKEVLALRAKKSPLAAFLKEQMDEITKPLVILQCLVILDKVDLGSGSDKQRAALAGNIKTYGAALGKLQTAIAKYVKLIDAALKLTPTVKDEKTLMLTPTPLKTLVPETYRYLKLLKTEAQAIQARAENALDGAKNAGKLAAISAAKNEADKKVKGSDEKANAQIKANSADAAMQTFLVSFGSAFKSAMAKGAAGIQKIKASPDVTTWNANIKIARDISQNLNNIVKLKANAKYKDAKLAKKLTDPGSLAKDIEPYCNGKFMGLASTTTDAEVKQLLKDFSTLYKTIATTYKDVIDGKLK